MLLQPIGFMEIFGKRNPLIAGAGAAQSSEEQQPDLEGEALLFDGGVYPEIPVFEGLGLDFLHGHHPQS